MSLSRYRSVENKIYVVRSQLFSPQYIHPSLSTLVPKRYPKQINVACWYPKCIGCATAQTLLTGIEQNKQWRWLVQAPSRYQMSLRRAVAGVSARGCQQQQETGAGAGDDITEEFHRPLSTITIRCWYGTTVPEQWVLQLTTNNFCSPHTANN